LTQRRADFLEENAGEAVDMGLDDVDAVLAGDGDGTDGQGGPASPAEAWVVLVGAGKLGLRGEDGDGPRIDFEPVVPPCGKAGLLQKPGAGERIRWNRVWPEKEAREGCRAAKDNARAAERRTVGQTQVIPPLHLD